MNKFYKNFLVLFNLVFIFLCNPLNGLISELSAQVFIKDDKIMSNEIIIKFNKQIVNIPIGEKTASVYNIKSNAVELKKYFQESNAEIILEKLIPDAKPYDTLWTNERGEVKKLNDWSQVFKLKFNTPIDLEAEIKRLRSIPNVEFVEPPVQIKFNQTPNDIHQEGNQWYLTKIDAEDAWNISKGDNIRVALIEGGVESHDDVDNKLISGESGYSSSHGIEVAGVAGAVTNNDTGIASLGWDLKIIPMNYNNGTDLAADIRNAANPSLLHKAKIINCSFKTIIYTTNNNYYSYNYTYVQDAIEDAQAFGAIVIASAGNPIFDSHDLDVVPHTIWPAAYTGVIGVSATNSNDQFPSGYNYGSFVDVSAPSVGILTTGPNDSYVTVDGTSFGAPLTSALCGLILSIDDNLTDHVEQIIGNSSEDLGSSGRDNYYGYGRIAAHEALKYTFLHYDITLTGAHTFL